MFPKIHAQLFFNLDLIPLSLKSATNLPRLYLLLSLTICTVCYKMEKYVHSAYVFLIRYPRANACLNITNWWAFLTKTALFFVMQKMKFCTLFSVNTCSKNLYENTTPRCKSTINATVYIGTAPSKFCPQPDLSERLIHLSNFHTAISKYIYIYIYICVCVCVCGF